MDEPASGRARGREEDAHAALAAEAPVGLLSLDDAGVVRAMNAMAATLLGRDASAVRGVPFHRLFPERERARCETVVARGLAGTPGAVTLAHATDGDAVRAHVDVAVRPGGPHGGVVASVHLHARSPEEARLADENARLRSEADDARTRLQEIVDGLDAVVWEADARTGAFTFVSKRAEDLLGYPVDTWLGDASFWETHLHPRDRERCLAQAASGADAPGRRALEYRFVAADGRTVWLRDVAYVVPDEAGEARWLRGLMVDATAEKRAEQQITLQHAVANALVAAADPGEAARTALRTIAETMGWEAGVLWYHAPGEGVMRATELAARTDEALCVLRESSASWTLARGDGGAAADAWRTGCTALTLHPDPGAPSYAATRGLGLAAVTAVPLTAVDGVHGVLEFFHAPEDAPHAEAREALEAVGALVGLFVERKRAEERAREERGHLSAIMESALDAIVGVDAYGRVREFNAAAERGFGWLREEALGEELSALLEVDAARSAYESAIAAVMDAEAHGNAGARLEVTGMRRNGERFPAEVTVAEVPGPGPIAFSFTIRDITQRKEKERELRRLIAQLDRERDRLEDLVASVPGVVWEAWGEPGAGDQRAGFVSGYVENLLGYSREEWLSEPNFWLKIVHPEDREAAAARAAELFRSRDPGTNAFRWVRKDGGVVDALAISRTIRDAEGTPIGMRGLTLDVTGEKSTERRLALQLAVASRLAKTSSLLDVAGDLVADIGRALDWTVGAYWTRDEETGILRCHAFWSGDPARTGAFEEATRTITFSEGKGLPGRVVARGEPDSIRDVTRDGNFPRGDAAAEAGLRGAFALPVTGKTGIVGVLEFFTRETLDADAQLMDAARGVSVQISAFLERARARERAHEELARRSAMVDAALDAIVSIDVEGRVTEWNPAAERTFGWSRGEALGRSLAGLIVPREHRDAHRAGLARHVRTGESRVTGRRLRMPALTRDGRRLTVELAIVRVPTDGAPAFTAFMRELPGDA